MPRETPKRHLLDIRQLAVFGRSQTRCGKFRKGWDPGKFHKVLWIADWAGQVDLLPEKEGAYCQMCLRLFKSNEGEEEMELYGKRLPEEYSSAISS
ncbi:MAG: hypothetical protein Q8P59_03825, partial [Dehalococcoidia bacterium]|nr:hypothetical protein [Dehalococcoidia bacterium]